MRYEFNACAIALSCVVLGSGNASAQQANPFSELLGTIQKIASGPGLLKTPQTDKPDTQIVGGNAATDDIMQVVSSNYRHKANTHSCKFYQSQSDEIGVAQRTGKFLDAATRAKMQASLEAACALQGFGPPLAQAKIQVGTWLAVASLNYHNAGMVIDDTVLDAQHAVTLLKLDAAANAAMIAKLENTFWPKGQAASARPDESMTALEAATKWQKNTFAFERDYLGKTLQVKGRVLGIAGSEKSAFVRLEGIKRDVNDRSTRDTVDCEIKDDTEMDAAAQISKDDIITVVGAVHKGLLPGVALTDCRIVR